MTNDITDYTKMTMAQLNEARCKYSRANKHEYATRGNTQRCQELWAEIEKIDKEISKRFRF